MKNMKKKVMAMIFAAMMTVGASAFAAAPAGGYSENGDYEAVVNTDIVPTAQADPQGYSENGDYTAVVNTDVPQETDHSIDHVGYSENGDYQTARA